MAKRIVLVHGLGGTSDGTWGQFPKFLDDDDEIKFTIHSIGYESPHILLQCWKRAPSILNIANGILTDLKARYDLENDEIIIAGHSLGGVVVKKLLLMMKDKKITHNIKKVCFFDVPHDGSGFANVGKHIAFRNRHLKVLCRDSSELDDLNDQWSDSGLGNSLDIMSILAANDDIVSSLSSKSIFRHHKVETINNTNHKTIVKPESTDSTVYIVFKKFILEKITLRKYKTVGSRDIYDWKSVDRNHNYHYASDEKRSRDFEALVTALKLDRSIVRLTGASGLGKTRLLLEAIETINIDESCVLIFDAPRYEKEIIECVKNIVEDGVSGLVIIENCTSELHAHLTREAHKVSCFIKLVTIGYSDEKVDDSILIQLSPLSDAAINEVLAPILIGLDPNNVDRVAKFAQGYPLMATLIAEQYQKEGRLLGSIESNSVVKKLIHSDGGISPEEQSVLSACSLFDVFGTAEGRAGEEAKFIAENVAGSSLQTFDRVVRTFTRRQIINRAGRYARVVPKPLALTLASEWWDEASYDRQQALIDNLPESLLHSFCTQASYLDHQPSVQRFSDKLFGGQSPFIQAEVLLTERGSRLFRAFVEVNPKSTSEALYRTLKGMQQDQLQSIEGETRRNLVWALEKLCFHADFFEMSAWCMLLLASGENENFSNNAAGMFSQLFSVSLSGTQATPKSRFNLLKQALTCESVHIDMVVLDALSQALNTSGGTRTIGAEYQGTKAPLEEWKPTIWQDIFDFWQCALDILIVMLERGENQKEKALECIGNSVRGLVAHNQIKMLDTVIKQISSQNGCYWPAALASIKNVLLYDSKDLKDEDKTTLQEWLDILSPNHASFSDKLKILIVNPSWEHQTDEEGNYIDVASENAKIFAIEVSRNIDALYPHIPMLLARDVKQSYSFGYHLADKLENHEQLFYFTLEALSTIEQANPNLALGMYRSFYEQSPEMWQERVDLLLSNEKLVKYYPDFIRSGEIQPHHLNVLLRLIKNQHLTPASANSLSYGSVTSNIDPEVISNFCLELSKVGAQGSWTALSIIYMYCFGKPEKLECLQKPVKHLVASVPLSKNQSFTTMDVHHWKDLSTKLLKIRDPHFAEALARQLLDACKIGLDHGHIWEAAKPLLSNLMKEYHATLWPIFGQAIIDSQGLERYWLQQVLKRDSGFLKNMPSIFSVIPVEIIISWCSDYPDKGPAFVASCLNVFDTIDDVQQPSPLFLALLEKFGDDERVTGTLRSSLISRSWSGSLIPYLQADKEALTILLDHSNINVRLWTKQHIDYIDSAIKSEADREAERDIGHF
ncbi:esterase/lipase family protein [Pseudomonas fragi]|uniref:esterase/lipase family protein n=1 Tax=Pseudomonas fragi TaxID=296 RepID=UPI001472C55C|nr:alpha/beta hydrolase [Pseudomonas fragi]NNB52789.1 alpha/beta hydrolase [Pseudomonas fragi]